MSDDNKLRQRDFWLFMCLCIILVTMFAVFFIWFKLGTKEYRAGYEAGYSAGITSNRNRLNTPVVYHVSVSPNGTISLVPKISSASKKHCLDVLREKPEDVKER